MNQAFIIPIYPFIPILYFLKNFPTSCNLLQLILIFIHLFLYKPCNV